MVLAPDPERIVEELVSQRRAKDPLPVELVTAGGALQQIQQGQFAPLGAIAYG